MQSLLLNIGRSEIGWEKSKEAVHLPVHITLNGHKYELCAFVRHEGENADSGHHIAYRNTRGHTEGEVSEGQKLEQEEGDWYELDDSRVTWIGATSNVQLHLNQLERKRKTRGQPTQREVTCCCPHSCRSRCPHASIMLVLSSWHHHAALMFWPHVDVDLTVFVCCA